MMDKRTWVVLWVTLAAVFCIPYGAGAGKTGKLYVVGMGPAGPDLTAPRALEIVKNADYYFCSPRMPLRFEAFKDYIDPAKVVYFQDGEYVQTKGGKNDPQSRKASREQKRKKAQEFIMEKINAGKNVVMMDGGDACVYGPTLNGLLLGLDEEYYEVVPGMGAFNAAAAALKRSLTCEDSRFVMLTSPRSLMGKNNQPKDDILKDLAKYKSTMVLYMSLGKLSEMTAQFKKYFPPDYPVSVVYYAGYADRESVLHSSLGNIEEDVKKMDEKWLGLVVMGECVKRRD